MEGAEAVLHLVHAPDLVIAQVGSQQAGGYSHVGPRPAIPPAQVVWGLARQGGNNVTPWSLLHIQHWVQAVVVI